MKIIRINTKDDIIIYYLLNLYIYVNLCIAKCFIKITIDLLYAKNTYIDFVSFVQKILLKFKIYFVLTFFNINVQLVNI